MNSSDASQHHSDAQRYTRIAVLLHWSIALLVLFNLAIGPFMEGFPMPAKGLAIFLHVSSGFTILALTVLRIVWRLGHRPPPMLEGGQKWEKSLASAVHVLLYALLVCLPLTGWGLISSNPPPGVVDGPASQRGRPPVVWGLVKVPLIAPLQQIGATLDGVPRQKKIHDDLVNVHAFAGFFMMALVALHILGALKHELFDGHRELRRMSLPLRRKARPKARS